MDIYSAATMWEDVNVTTPQQRSIQIHLEVRSVGNDGNDAMRAMDRKRKKSHNRVASPASPMEKIL
jgi:hypothetical protein